MHKCPQTMRGNAPGRVQARSRLHNALLGIGGRITQLFPTQRERALFGRTDEYRHIIPLLENLQQEPKAPSSPKISRPAEL